MSVTVGKVTFDQKAPFILIAGPCQIESRENVFEIASVLKKITTELDIDFVFKSSFDKANRTDISTPRGLGIDMGLSILAEVRQEFSIPVLTDIHTVEQCARVAEAVDILQIPAFLSRQTDLLLAAGKTGKAVNVKKGQFLAPKDIKQVAAKIASTGNEKILLTERGVSFGYHTLVNDFRALPIMAETGYPIIFDATHSVQQPGGLGIQSGGQREFAPVLAKAALAVGVAGVFVETHPDPDKALSDAPNTLPLSAMATLLAQWKKIDDVAKSLPEIVL